MFDKSSKSKGVFRTQASICHGAFLWVFNGLFNELSTAYYFYNKSYIIDVWPGYMLYTKMLKFSKWSLCGANHRDCYDA